MTRYLISFGAHAMDMPAVDMPAVAKAAHAVVQETINAGVHVSAGGLENQPASIVAIDGTVTDGPYPEAIGGYTLIDVPSREEAPVMLDLLGSQLGLELNPDTITVPSGERVQWTAPTRAGRSWPSAGTGVLPDSRSWSPSHSLTILRSGPGRRRTIPAPSLAAAT
jgi:hypothetical protein